MAPLNTLEEFNEERKAFLEGFAAGYRADGFIRDEFSGRRRCYYVLSRPILSRTPRG